MDLFVGKFLLGLLVVKVGGIRVDENNNGYSRIFVDSPGVRQYTYGISHNPEGRDFSIDFNPYNSAADFAVGENSLEGRNGPQYSPHYNQYMVNDQQLYQEQERSVKHAGYGNAGGAGEDFDLGMMGYGDFMDGPELDFGISPKSAPGSSDIVAQSSPRIFVPTGTNYEFRPVNQGNFNPPKKFVSKNQFQQGYRPKFQVPKIQYGFKPVTEYVGVTTVKPLFLPSQMDGHHLKGLGDKAYSKVFMTQGHTKKVVKLYPKPNQYGRGEYNKALFVPVVFVPGPSKTQNNKVNDFHRDRYIYKSN